METTQADRDATLRLPRLTLPRKPTYIRLSSDVDFFALFRTLEKESDHCYLLESLDESAGESRYSVIGFQPQAVLTGRPGRLEWAGADGSSFETPCDNPYRVMAAWTPQNIIARLYAGGLVGYLGYDSMNFFEPVLNLANHPDFAPFVFGAYTDGLILDKMTGEVFYFYYTEDRSDRVRRWLAAAPPAPGNLRARSLGFTRTREEHAAMVQQAIEEICAGNTFQCQIGFQENFELEGDPLAIYGKLREVSPSPYMFYVKMGARALIGASPELVFRLRQGEMETYPLAGTTRRGATPEEDVRLARLLLNDPKEIAEHNMLVDLHRNDLGRIARFGTVKVRRLMDARKFSHVQHISSEVVGIIRKDCSAFRGLESVFPAGTLSGAPKIESMKIIDRIEQSPRGPYGGAIGQFSFSGECTFAIPIRTLFVNGSRAYARASGGIVYDSRPEGEYQEIMNKLASVRRTLSHFMPEAAQP